MSYMNLPRNTLKKESYRVVSCEFSSVSFSSDYYFIIGFYFV